MKKQLEKLKIFLEEDDFVAMDIILADVHTSGKYSEEQINEYGDIFQEITLYSEFKEATYKDAALKLINEL